MAFRQVKNLLEWIDDFHHRLSDQYTIKSLRCRYVDFYPTFNSLKCIKLGA